MASAGPASLLGLYRLLASVTASTPGDSRPLLQPRTGLYLAEPLYWKGVEESWCSGQWKGVECIYSNDSKHV